MANKLLINCDMGEWDAPHMTNLDADIMPFVDMTNIACGGHAGSKEIIRSTIRLAKIHGVSVGAHPGFEDRLGFGRKYIDLTEGELIDSLTRQLTLFLTICNEESTHPFHVKAHGALYHACNQNEKEARALIEVVSSLCPSAVILVSPDSPLDKSAEENGLKTMTESFVDRRYNDDLTLVSRTIEGAVISDVRSAYEQYHLLSSEKVKTRTGSTKPIQSQTTCIHGDNPNCLNVLKYLRDGEL